MHSLPDHAWLLYLGDGQAHQWRLPHAPDDEGIVSAVCEVEAMPGRLVDDGVAGRCTCGCLLVLPPTDDTTTCVGCQGTWTRGDWRSRGLLFDLVRCVTCLLRAGDDYVAVLAERLPTNAEFQHAVRNMRTEGPSDAS